MPKEAGWHRHTFTVNGHLVTEPQGMRDGVIQVFFFFFLSGLT